MESSPIKAQLIHADRQTDKHKGKWRICNHANAHKISCDSRKLGRTRQHFGGA
jgi:hypothetical protein